MKREEIIKSLKLLGIINPTEQDILAYIQSLGANTDGMPQELIGATPISDLQPQMSAINTDIKAPTMPSDALNKLTANPEDLAMDLTGTLPNSDMGNKLVKNMMKQYLPSQSQILGGMNLAGQTLQRASIQGIAGTNAGILGGGLQGAASGFQMAGVGGGVLGGLLGGTMGYAASKEQEAARALLRQQEENAKFLANGVNPTKYAEGGEIMDGSGNVGIQTELGERIVLPNGDIVEVKADKLHKDMDKKQITDFVPEGSVIFSAKETKKHLINPKDYENEIMGYSVVNYDENDPNSTKLKEIKFGDIIGDKPLSPSDALEMIRKKYSTVSDDRKDIFSEATNKENKKARMPYISALVMEQAKNNGSLAPQQFGYGGGVRVRKYPDGGMYPNSKMPILNGNYNLPNMRYPQFNSPQAQTIGVYNDSGVAIGEDDARLPSNMYGAYYGLQLNAEKGYDPILNQGQLSRYSNDPNSYFNGTPIGTPRAGRSGVVPTGRFVNYTPSGGASITLDPNNPNSGKEWLIANAGLSPSLTGILPSQVLSNTPRTNPALPQTDSNTNENPYALRQAEIAAARADADVARVYEGLHPRQDKLDALNQQSYAQYMALGNKNIGIKTGIAGATALNELATTGMQNPMVYGKYQTPYNIDGQYRGMTPSQLDNQVSQLRSQANNTVAQLIGQGLTPSQAAVAAAPIIDASNQKEGELRSRFYDQQGTLDRAKYTALNTMRNANDAESARVQQQTLTTQNAITARLGAATANWLSQTDTINDNQYNLAQKALQNYTTNEQKLFGNRFNVANLEQVGKIHYAEKLNEQLLRLQANNDRKEQYRTEEQKKKDELDKKAKEAEELIAKSARSNSIVTPQGTTVRASSYKPPSSYPSLSQFRYQTSSFNSNNLGQLDPMDYYQQLFSEMENRKQLYY
jgi:hypothetical protein